MQCLQHMCPPYTHAGHTCLCIFSSFLYFINHMLLELQHDACCSCVLPLPRLFKFYSACSLPHFCCPFSYTLTELLCLPGPPASYLLQPSWLSFCQQAFIVHPSVLFSLSISLFTLIFHLCFPTVLLSLLFMLAIPFLLFTAINALCSINDCYFILIIIWFMPVIHSLLVIYTHLLLALCLFLNGLVSDA